jgi:hypothetical protein
MDQFKHMMKEKTAVFDKVGNQIKPLQGLAQSTEMNTGFFIAAAIAVFGFFLMLFHGIEIMFTLWVVVYPGIESIKAIESHTGDDDKEWLCYWMVMGVLNILTTFFPFVFWIIPYWSYLKFGLFVWMIHFKGASIMFHTVDPLLKAHQKEIEGFLSHIQDQAANLGDAAKDAVHD